MNTNDGFNIAYAKYLGRKDVYRIDVQNGDSPYMGVSVLSDATGIVVRRFDENGEHPFEANTLETLSTDQVVFSLTRMSYGVNSLQGADILSKINKVFADNDQILVAASRKNNVIEIHKVLRRSKKDGSWSYVGTLAWKDSTPFTEEEADCFPAWIAQYIDRAESNKPVQDQRKTEFDGIPTLYGLYVAQQDKERAARKANK